MNTNETVKASDIQSLLDNGVLSITVGRPPDGSAPYFVQATQGCPTGAAGNHMQVSHQTCGDSVRACVDKLIGQLTDVAKHAAIPAPPTKNGDGKVINLGQGRG